MSDDADERVTGVLDDAAGALASIPADAEEATLDDLDDESTLWDAAEEAREISETTDPEEVLDAVGLSELPDGSEPSSIPAAIAGGDSERVTDLRALLALSRLADDRGDEEAVAGRLSDLRGTLDDRIEAARESEREEGGAEEVEGETEEVTEEGAGAEEASEEGAGAEESPLRAALDDALGGFGDEVAALRDRVEGMRSDETGGEGAEGVEAKAEEEPEGEELEEGAGAEEEEEDDGLLSGLGESGPSGAGTMHSTVAPSPSDRDDMHAVARFSTMPKRDR